MDVGDILLSSFKFPLSDTNKFIKISIPSLAVAAIFALMMIFSFMSNGSSPSNALYTLVGLLGIIFFILIFVVAIINSGLVLNVIKNLIKGQDELPELDIGRFALDGIKNFIVVFIYILVPSIILAIISVLFVYLRLTAVSLIMMLLLYVVLFIISLLLPAIYGKLAETNSISEALSISEIWEITKQIQFVKIFVTLLILNAISSFIVIVMFFSMVIPIIGPFIAALLLTYFATVSGHIYGLLYLEKYQNGTAYNQYPNNQYSNNQNQFNQPNQEIQSNQQLPQNNQIQDNTPVQNNQMDFQRPNTEQKEDNTDFQRPNTQEKTAKVELCPNCGTENKENAKFCMTCGEEL